MADVAEPGECQACGRPLAPQQGRGRQRRYCDARCRDAARRQRASVVKKNLTPDHRHAYLDNVDGTSSADDPVARRVAQTARRLIEEFARGTSPEDAVAAARDLSAAAEAALQAAVDRARAAGQSWREIGDVVGTSRQAAFQRFGHPVDPRTGTPMTRVVAPSAVQRAEEFVATFTSCRWEQVLGDLDDSIRDRLDVNRLAAGWAQMIGIYGSFQGSGEVSPVSAGDGTVVDVRLDFEAGEAMLLVQWNSDGKITGLRIHRAAT